MTQQTFESRLNEFVANLQQLYNDDYAKNYPSLTPSKISIEPGKKNIRIVETHMNMNGTEGQRMVYCFINKATGDIYKAAGWKAPAKGARGSIWNQYCDVGVKANIHGSGLYR